MPTSSLGACRFRDGVSDTGTHPGVGHRGVGTGEDKSDAAKRAFVDEPSRATPGSLVRATRGTTTVVLDAAVAAIL